MKTDLLQFILPVSGTTLSGNCYSKDDLTDVMNNTEIKKEKCAEKWMSFTKPHAQSKLYLAQAVVFYFKWSWRNNGVIKIKHFGRLCYSVSVTCLTHTHFSSLLFCCCHPPSLFLSLSVPHLCPSCICFIAFFLISPSTSLLCSHLLSSCHATFLSPPFPSPLFLSSLASHLHYPPPCNCVHSLKIFPLHSNAPPHYCSLCCRWCRRQCRDVKTASEEITYCLGSFSSCLL